LSINHEKPGEIESWILRGILKSGIKLCELRPSPPVEYSDGGDTDYLVDFASFNKLVPSLHSLFLGSDISFVTRSTSSVNVKLYVLLDVPYSVIIFDFWKIVQIKDPRDKNPCWQSLRWKDLENSMTLDEKSLFRLSANAGLSIYITHLFTMKKDPDKDVVRWRLEHYRKNIDSGAFRYNGINENIQDSCIHALEYLSKQRIYQRRLAIIAFLYDALIARLIRYTKFNPTPYFGAVFGVDGAGKTSLLSNVIDNSDIKLRKIHFRSLYKNTFLYKILTLPYSKFEHSKTINEFDNSIIFPLFLISLSKFRRTLTQSSQSTVILDRFFYDFFLTHMSNRKTRKKPTTVWWSWIISPFLPAPPFCIWVKVSFETSRKRKNELNQAQWESYNKHIFDRILTSKHKTICVISNNGHQEESNNKLAYCIDHFLKP
jgi:thymidylate kinase